VGVKANMIPKPLSRATAAIVFALMATTAVRAEDTIVIGFGGGLTGSLAFYDRSTRNGAQMAVNEINAAGGIAGRYKIDLRVKDVLSEKSASAAAGREFVAGGANMLIAPCDLDTAVAFSEPAQQAGIPIIAPCASTATLAAAVGDFMFQIYPADNLQAAVLAKFAREQGYGRAYILQPADTPAMEMLPRYFANAFENMGGTLVGKSAYASGQQDFGAAVGDIKHLSPQPDVVVTAAREPEFPIFVSQLRAAGVTIPVLGSDAIDSPTTLALGDAADGVVYTSAAYPLSGSALEAFYRDYAAKFGGDAQTDVAPYAATAYEAIKLIEVAIARAGSTDGAAIRDALNGITDFEGITGSRITLASANRVALRAAMLIRVENGAKTPIKMLQPEAAEIPPPSTPLQVER
jgi:branched-chain amino acid transport system substrate-binding protein